MVQKCLDSTQFQTSIQKFFELLTKTTEMAKDRKVLTQEGLLIAITSCLWKINRHNDSQTGAKIDIDKDLASK